MSVKINWLPIKCRKSGSVCRCAGYQGASPRKQFCSQGALAIGHHPLLSVDRVCCAESLQSCLTLRNAMGWSLPVSSARGIPRQEHWRGSPCPPPEDLPDPEIKLVFLSPAVASGLFTTSTAWETPVDPYCKVASLRYPGKKSFVPFHVLSASWKFRPVLRDPVFLS